VNIAILRSPNGRTPNLEYIDPYQLGLMEASLRVRRWRVSLCDYHPYRIEALLSQERPDVILNLAYGYSAPWEFLHESQPDVASRLESLGYRCVGSDSKAQYVAQDKCETAAVLKLSGIRSPNTLPATDWPDGINYGVLKPRYGAYHRGIQVIQRGQYSSPLLSRPDVLLQEYIDGPEYTVAVLEDVCTGEVRVLPPVHINFQNDKQGPSVMSWDGPPWRIEVDEQFADVLRPLALSAFQVLGLRDYARFDFRIGHDGPVLIDANALPGLHPIRGMFARAALSAGIDYHCLIWNLIESRLARD
jgi:D-alanine-D-alanine ligase